MKEGIIHRNQLIPNSFNDTHILNECHFVHMLLLTIRNQCHWNLKTVPINSST